MRAGFLSSAAVVLLSAACGGRIQVDAHPAPPPDAPPAAPTTPASDPGPADSTGRLVAVVPAGDTALAVALPAAKDSAADAAALDSLTRTTPNAALPDVTPPTWDINVADFTDQPRVQYYLDYFSGKAHDRFQIWLTRMPRYEGYIRARLAEHGLPGDLVYLSLIESGFAPDAVSRASAVGMWQFIAETARLYGLRIDQWVDERRDPIKSTDAATRDLEQLTERFGSHYLAAAAYNAGAGKVERGLDLIGSTSGEDEAFFSLADTRLLREETKNYVPQLIAAALIAKEPVRYGFDAPVHVTPFSRDSVMVDGGTGLDLIARLAGTTFDAMRDLNPNLLRGVTPPGVSYPVRVPAGTADSVAAQYADLAVDARRAMVPHRVTAGETVSTIAHTFSVSPDAIRNANRVARRQPRLAPGTLLYIPVTSAIPAWMLREPDPPLHGTASRTVAAHAGGGATYMVESGETLSGIAQANGTTVAALLAANRMSSPNSLRAGQQLVIPSSPAASQVAALPGAAPAPSTAAKVVPSASGPSAAPSAAPVVKRTHVVKAGETISGIAARYGVAQATLLDFNQLTKAARIYVGELLRIPGR